MGTLAGSAVPAIVSKVLARPETRAAALAALEKIDTDEARGALRDAR
jgi:hypothetical protein